MFTFCAIIAAVFANEACEKDKYWKALAFAALALVATFAGYGTVWFSHLSAPTCG